MRRRVVRVLRGCLLQTDPNRGGFLARRAGQLSRRFELVGAPDLPQDPAPVTRLVLHQEAGETALRQDDGAEECVAVEPQQLLDAIVDAPDLLDLLDGLVVVAEPAKLRAHLPDAALTAAAQRTSDLPGFPRHPEAKHDAQVARRVVHQLLVRAGREGGLPVQGVGDRFEDGGLARAGVADDGDVIPSGEVDGRRAGAGALRPRGRTERAQAFDGEVDGAHVNSCRGSAHR